MELCRVITACNLRQVCRPGQQLLAVHINWKKVKKNRNQLKYATKSDEKGKKPKSQCKLTEYVTRCFVSSLEFDNSIASIECHR